MIFKSKKNLHLISFSSLFIVCSLLLNTLLYPITKIFLGIMGVDSFLVLLYSVFIYSFIQVDISKIVAINISHITLRSLFIPDFISNVSISLATVLFLLLLLLYNKFSNTNEFSIKTFKRRLFLAFFFVDTLIISLFAIFSYYYFGLLKWIAIGSIISAPLAGALTSFAMMFLTFVIIAIYPKHFEGALRRIQRLR